MTMADAFYDLQRLQRYRQILTDADPARSPRAASLTPEVQPPPGRLALVPGSFNPPTTAHVALARSVLDTHRVDRVDFVLATKTINKEEIEGLTLDDRLLLLSLLIQERSDLGVDVVNRGLFVDQAEIIRKAMPSLQELWFVVGFDKIVQIFDSKYYTDRDASLRRLFSLSSFFVAPRGSSDFEDLDSLLQLPNNRQFANAVRQLPLPNEFRDVSSSHLREEVSASGRFPDVPPLVADFLVETGAFASPRSSTEAGLDAVDRYAWRVLLLDLHESGRLQLTSSQHFRDLVAAVTSPDAAGQELRTQLIREAQVLAAPAPSGQIS